MFLGHDLSVFNLSSKLPTPSSHLIFHRVVVRLPVFFSTRTVHAADTLAILTWGSADPDHEGVPPG